MFYKIYKEIKCVRAVILIGFAKVDFKISDKKYLLFVCL